MRNYSTYKIVWDRRGSKGNAPVEIEIHLPDGTRKYVATGLKIPVYISIEKYTIISVN